MLDLVKHFQLTPAARGWKEGNLNGSRGMTALMIEY